MGSPFLFRKVQLCFLLNSSLSQLLNPVPVGFLVILEDRVSVPQKRLPCTGSPSKKLFGPALRSRSKFRLLEMRTWETTLKKALQLFVNVSRQPVKSNTDVTQRQRISV